MSDLEADVSAGFSFTIGKLNQAQSTLDSMNTRLAKATMQPVFGVAVGSTSTLESTDWALIKIPGPTQGFLRQIRRILVGPASPESSATGAAVFVYSCKADISPNPALMITAQGMLDLVDFDNDANFPWLATYSRGEFVQHAQENLIVITSGPEDSPIVASVRFEEYQDGALQQGYSF